MISRLNFLLAVSILTLLGFYLAGRFLFLKALLSLAPGLAPYFTAAYGLAALMLTVLVLAKTVIRLAPLSSAAPFRQAGLHTLLAQTALYAGHGLVVLAVYAVLAAQDAGPVSWSWLLAIMLYAAGIAGAINDWRKRAPQAQ